MDWFSCDLSEYVFDFAIFPWRGFSTAQNIQCLDKWDAGYWFSDSYFYEGL